MVDRVVAPQARIYIGTATYGGQQVPVTISVEWMRYLEQLTAQSNSFLSSALVGAQGVAGASVMLDDESDSGDQMFIVQNITNTTTGGGTWTEVEIDFGSTPVYDATFTITDAAITSSAVKMVLVPCGKAATGRTADDWQWDGGTFVANPGTGSATCYATFSPGPIVGPRKLQYQIG